MALIRIEDENREITELDEMREFLDQFGIWYEHWEVAGRLPEDPSNEQILETYKPEIDRLSERGGFVTADVINVTSAIPNLDELLAKFSKEHTHVEDEVRFVVSGSGIFHIHPEGGPVFGVLVESGDLINVPKDTLHWFDLCQDKQIRCIRLFQDPEGWVAHYADNPVNEKYSPLCWGPNYIAKADNIDSVVKP